MENSIDFGALDARKGADAGFELQLVDAPTRQPLPGLVLRIRGYDSAAYQEVLREHQRRRLARARGKRITVEELEAESLELAATLVMSWPEGATVGGKPATAIGLVSVPEIRLQVEAGAADLANFLPGSAKSS